MKTKISILALIITAVCLIQARTARTMWQSSSTSDCSRQLDAVRATADRQVGAVAAAGKEVVMADGASDGQLESRTAGYELAVPGGGGGGGRKVLGSRDFALFYR